MSDFGLHHSRDEAIADPDPATRAHPAPFGGSQTEPKPGEVLNEIGIVLVLHLAVALAVLLALRTFGVS